MKKMMKLSALVATVIFSGSAMAVMPGSTYLGGGLGYSNLQKRTTGIPSVSSNTGGLGGRIFTGYNFTQYVGMELGFASYAASKYTGSAGTVNLSAREKMYALDLVAKGYLPIETSGFSLFALAGIAEVHDLQKASNSSGVNNGVYVAGQSLHRTVNQLRPKFGVGASYDISPEVTTSVEWSRIQGNGSSNAVPNADLMTLNVSYNFN